MVFVIGMGFYRARNLNKKEICEGLVLSKPFFTDFGERLSPVFRSLREMTMFIAGKIFGKGIKKFFPIGYFLALTARKYYCRFSNYVRGRHLLKRNGCKGYWRKINDCKNNKNDLLE
jgi:hypothetical protein